MNLQDTPAPQNVFEAAVHWLQSLLLGSVGSMIAIIAVASVGFLLFAGRVDVRRATQVILGCFILFGASSIAAGIVRVVNEDTLSNGAPPPPLAIPAGATPPMQARTAYDPYAGAALPPRP